MILDLFIYIIQFYINQNTFLPGFIIRKEPTPGEEKDYAIKYVNNVLSLIKRRNKQCIKNHRKRDS